VSRVEWPEDHKASLGTRGVLRNSLRMEGARNVPMGTSRKIAATLIVSVTTRS